MGDHQGRGLFINEVANRESASDRIREGITSAMLFWPDMFDIVWNVRIFFGKPTVLTPTVGAVTDSTTYAWVH